MAWTVALHKTDKHKSEDETRRMNDKEGKEIKKMLTKQLEIRKHKKMGIFSIEGLYDDKPNCCEEGKNEAKVEAQKEHLIDISEEHNNRHVMIANFIKENIKRNHDDYVKIICNVMRNNMSRKTRQQMRRQTKNKEMRIPLCCDSLPNRYKYKCGKYNKYSLFHDIYLNIFYFLVPAISKRQRMKNRKNHKSRYEPMKNIFMPYINFYEFDSFLIISPLLFNTMRYFHFWCHISSKDSILVHGPYHDGGTPQVITAFSDFISCLTQYTHIIICLQNGKVIYIERNKKYKIHATEKEFFNDAENPYHDCKDFWTTNTDDATQSDMQMIFSFESVKLTKFECRKYYIDKNIFGCEDYYIDIAKVYIYDRQAFERIREMYASKGIWKLWDKWQAMK